MSRRVLRLVGCWCLAAAFLVFVALLVTFLNIGPRNCGGHYYDMEMGSVWYVSHTRNPLLRVLEVCPTGELMSLPVGYGIPVLPELTGDTCSAWRLGRLPAYAARIAKECSDNPEVPDTVRIQTLYIAVPIVSLSMSKCAGRWSGLPRAWVRGHALPFVIPLVLVLGHVLWRATRAAVSRWRRKTSVDLLPRCRGCGYSLKGAGSPRCPECGTPFELEGVTAEDVNA